MLVIILMGTLYGSLGIQVVCFIYPVDECIALEHFTVER